MTMFSATDPVPYLAGRVTHFTIRVPVAPAFDRGCSLPPAAERRCRVFHGTAPDYVYRRRSPRIYDMSPPLAALYRRFHRRLPLSSDVGIYEFYAVSDSLVLTVKPTRAAASRWQ